MKKNKKQKKKTELRGYVKYFSVDFNSINTNNILYIKYFRRSII